MHRLIPLLEDLGLESIRRDLGVDEEDAGCWRHGDCMRLSWTCNLNKQPLRTNVQSLTSYGEYIQLLRVSAPIDGSIFVFEAVLSTVGISQGLYPEDIVGIMDHTLLFRTKLNGIINASDSHDAVGLRSQYIAVWLLKPDLRKLHNRQG